MFKYRILMSAIVLALLIVSGFAQDNNATDASLTFINPLTSAIQNTESAVFGEGDYRLETDIYGQTAHMDLAFWNLTPNTDYVLWCISTPTDSEQGQFSKPCADENSQEIVVQSDATGQANLSASIDALPSTTDTRLSMIALVYDLESHAYGASREEVATDSYIYLFATLPMSHHVNSYPVFEKTS